MLLCIPQTTHYRDILLLGRDSHRGLVAPETLDESIASYGAHGFAFVVGCSPEALDNNMAS